MSKCIQLVAEVRDEAIRNAHVESDDKGLELIFMLAKYKALCITLDKIHNALVEIESLAKDEKAHYLIINLKDDEEEQTQAN